MIDVNIPEVEEYAEVYRHYGPRAEGPGRQLFDLVMRPEVLVAASVLTRVLGAPAVAAVAGDVNALAGGQPADTDKQYVGTLVCRLMELNGFRKTGRQKAIPVAGWNRGEVYVVADA